MKEITLITSAVCLASILVPLCASEAGAKRKPSTFNPAYAPAPDKCFLSFVHTVRSASSMTQIFPFLPAYKVDALKSMESRFDPSKEAEKRASWKKRSPNMSEETLDRFCGSPYKTEFKRLKKMANSIVKVGKAKVTGDEAKVIVVHRSNSVVRNKRYTKKSSAVKMRGEGRYWKYDGISDTGAVFR